MTRVVIRGKDTGDGHREKRQCEDTGGWWPSTSQGEKPQETPTLASNLILDF